jgi:hypothetical protein
VSESNAGAKCAPAPDCHERLRTVMKWQTFHVRRLTPRQMARASSGFMNRAPKRWSATRH